MKFERDGGSFEISLCVYSIRVFTIFSDLYYEPLTWFMMQVKLFRSLISLQGYYSIRNALQ